MREIHEVIVLFQVAVLLAILAVFAAVETAAAQPPKSKNGPLVPRRREFAKSH